MKTWRLDGAGQTLVLACDGGVPFAVYWGSPLPLNEDLGAVVAASQMDVTGGMLDAAPPVPLCPVARDSFAGQPALVAYRDGVLLRPDFRLTESESGAETGIWVVKDTVLGLTLSFAFETTGTLLRARTVLEATEPVVLHWLAAPVLPAPQQGSGMIDFAGRWCDEFQSVVTPWAAGARLRENPTGRTGHEHFPGLYLPGAGATNTQGAVQAMHYGWSGGHRMVAEQLPDGQRQVQFGNASGTEPGPVTRHATGWLYLAVSDRGMNGCATGFQRHVRDQIVTWPDPARPRPVHYNCWEAVYFDHRLDELKDIARRAAILGAERFVLDDGWFGRRDGDTTSLGDWQIDPRKYPDGLKPLIDHVHDQGMSFGIWFEPEMINPDSDLYRAHSDWVLGPTDQTLGRQQMVLDMAKAEVRDYLYDCMAAVLGSYDIDYVKWDHNRVLPISDAGQVRGTYALLDRLRSDFPKVEIESCSSGGGRIDFGILERTQRIWLSDSNDAVERLKIQHNAALFLPLAVTGSHVGPRTCHTSGRTIDIRFRAWVAAQRHLGFEMDPRELTEDEEQVLSTVCAWWKANRDWMVRADILRLDSGDPAVIAEQQLSEDGGRFVVFSGKHDTSEQITPRPLRLAGLNVDRSYHIDLVNRADAPRLSRGDQAIKSGPLVLSGAYLMQKGLVLPWSFPETMWVVEGQLV